MSYAALCMVIGAGALHAAWNALTKRSPDAMAFLWSLTLGSTVVFAIPVAWLIRRDGIDPDGLPWLISSGIIHIAYFLLIGISYRRADLSLAYPVSRGSGVLLIPIGSAIFFGAPPADAAWIGIACILAGILLLHEQPIRQAIKTRGWRGAFVWPALLNGVIIAVYSLIDARGVQAIHPLVYVYLSDAISLVGLSIILPLIGKGPEMRIAALERPHMAAIAGFGSVATYATVLAATRIAPVAYVGPMREISIVFGVLIGVRFLGEPAVRSRLYGAFVIFLGILAIKVFG